MSSNNLILRISKSRENIIKILKNHQYYDTSDYEDFSMHEVDAMFKNDQLDMIVNKKDNTRKTYVKYYTQAKPIRDKTIQEYIDDLFNIEQIMTKNDNLIIIVFDKPNESIINFIKHIYNHSGYFVNIHHIDRLQFNILEHSLVPHMSILDKDEIGQLANKYNLKSLEQLPEISRFDAQASAMSMRPGDVGCFERESETALTYEYYRICV